MDKNLGPHLQAMGKEEEEENLNFLKVLNDLASAPLQPHLLSVFQLALFHLTLQVYLCLKATMATFLFLEHTLNTPALDPSTSYSLSGMFCLQISV